AAGRNVALLAEQAREFRPAVVAVAERARELEAALAPDWRPEVLEGEEGLARVAAWPGVDIVLVAVTGVAGLLPTLAALKAGKEVALANKETLVAGGELVAALAGRAGPVLRPVDSEHSAIWQCLQGGRWEEVRELVLTASGGPFRLLDRAALERVTPEEALRHPNWRMGSKITVDSATLMNKGLEIIEAHWLFGIDYERIRVVVHPQSIVHGMVVFRDGAVLAQLGVPDMRLPIQYALSYPERWGPVCAAPDPVAVGALTFEAPDEERFPALRLAREAGKTGGTLPAVLNAANEVAVAAFLDRRLPFTGIVEVVARVMDRHRPVPRPALEDVLAADRWARHQAELLVAKVTP
ncbi:MAG: 1-deoxy-D-xylulose-5-phosphate reductoisomerase, partial [Firmicutes bacterium]|nr:1-deoxy-D-xylulose-5-phosphate reductoisomerase [Bacillota bacterium]